MANLFSDFVDGCLSELVNVLGMTYHTAMKVINNILSYTITSRLNFILFCPMNLPRLVNSWRILFEYGYFSQTLINLGISFILKNSTWVIQSNGTKGLKIQFNRNMLVFLLSLTVCIVSIQISRAHVEPQDNSSEVMFINVLN